jgi:hypothetical protein
MNCCHWLEKLAAEDSQKAELVKLRYFAALTTAKAAEMLHISIPTADRSWAYSRVWLFGEVLRLLAYLKSWNSQIVGPPLASRRFSRTR